MVLIQNIMVYDADNGWTFVYVFRLIKKDKLEAVINH